MMESAFASFIEGPEPAHRCGTGSAGQIQVLSHPEPVSLHWLSWASTGVGKDRQNGASESELMGGPLRDRRGARVWQLGQILAPIWS